MKEYCWGQTRPADDGLYHFMDADGVMRHLFPYEWEEGRWADRCPCSECQRLRELHGYDADGFLMDAEGEWLN